MEQLVRRHALGAAKAPPEPASSPMHEPVCGDLAQQQSPLGGFASLAGLLIFVALRL